ncbi:hypothetical protein CCB80_01175 [Armatimonadetes bacterium Uphvl-Ar1]|nr:hypothetical protein CCB80_01175 [Armatimonadetes bacterium Uphvl-Ar1]
MVLKARFGGYDGKGTRYARSREEFDSHRPLIDQGNWMAEQFVPFSRELAVMVYRSKTETGTFPTMETVQVNHVCDQVFPAGIDASEAAIAAVEAVQGYGLFGVELFETSPGTFRINEIAPRPHNTGHYTLDWGGVSQFEQHVRLAMGFPCALPTGADTCMVNILGIQAEMSASLPKLGEREPDSSGPAIIHRSPLPGGRGRGGAQIPQNLPFLRHPLPQSELKNRPPAPTGSTKKPPKQPPPKPSSTPDKHFLPITPKPTSTGTEKPNPAPVERWATSTSPAPTAVTKPSRRDKHSWNPGKNR